MSRMAQCSALVVPDTMWNFCPSLAASVLFIVLFSLTTGMHLFQGIWYRAPYTWVIILSGLTQVLTYVFRTVSIENPSSYGAYAAWFILILVAPLWTNAFAYVVFGRMVRAFTSDNTFLKVRGWQYATIFVILDIFAFIIQVYGAAKATASDVPLSTTETGLHIYMGGVGFQLLFLLIFAAISLKMFQTLRHTSTKAVRFLFVTQITAIALIMVRIIFRIVEYSQGLTSTVPKHEAFQYCLDSLPMLIALVAYNIVHPSQIIVGGRRDKAPSWQLFQREKGHRDIDTL